MLKNLKNMNDAEAGELLASMVDKRIEDEYYAADPDDMNENNKRKQ